LLEHHDILATLRARNADAANTVMFDHHWSVRDELVEAFKNGNGGSERWTDFPDPEEG